MKALLQKYRIDETFTKVAKKQTVFNHIKNNIPPIEDYNYMADLLMMPTTKEGYKMLLVVVDLANNDFDIEPIKNKEPKTILEAFQKMTKRKYIKIPYASVRTDGGTEFKGVFHKWLLDNEVLHKVALPDRHKQMANVENLNRSLARIFNGYMNYKEEQTKEIYREWTDILNDVRKDLNNIRKVKINKEQPEFSLVNAGKPKYKIGDLVFEKLDCPENALGEKQPTKNFREGDYRYSKIAKKIIKVLYMNDAPYYRYILEGIPNASFSESELMANKEKSFKYIPKKLINKKTVGKKVYYLVWWQGYLKQHSTYEDEKILIEDGYKNLIQEYERQNN